jgi:hypothetical protein
MQDIDVSNVSKAHQSYMQKMMKQLMDIYRFEYDPDKHGYLVYLQAGDDRALKELGIVQQLDQIPFEGGGLDLCSDCYYAIFVTNNSFAYTFIIPNNKEVISAKTQAVLEELILDSINFSD